MNHAAADDSHINDRLERARRVRGQVQPGSPEEEDARLDAAHLQRQLRDRTSDLALDEDRWSL